MAFTYSKIRGVRLHGESHSHHGRYPRKSFKPRQIPKKQDNISNLNMIDDVELFDDEVGSDERLLALQIMDGRKCANTKNQYRLKVERFREWVESKHPECLNDDTTLNLAQLDKSVLREFFGHICKKKDKAGAYLDPVVFHAFQHVSGYKSAIKDFYSNKEVTMSLDIQKML